MDKLKYIISNFNMDDIVVFSLYCLIIIIVFLIFYTLYLYISSEQLKKKKADFDIAIATKALDKFESKPRFIPEEFEKEEEENAIISYDELLEKTMNVPQFIENRVKEQDEYETIAPISIEEFKKQNELKEVVSYKLEEKEIDEKQYLKDLKAFRANLK